MLILVEKIVEVSLLFDILDWDELKRAALVSGRTPVAAL